MIIVSFQNLDQNSNLKLISVFFFSNKAVTWKTNQNCRMLLWRAILYIFTKKKLLFTFKIWMIFFRCYGSYVILRYKFFCTSFHTNMRSSHTKWVCKFIKFVSEKDFFDQFDLFFKVYILIFLKKKITENLNLSEN